MKFRCPSCGSSLNPSQLRTQWGGGSECPLCGAGLRWSPPYHMVALWGSFPILVFFIATEGVREGMLSILMMIVTWLIGSTVIAIVVSWIKPPQLKLKDNDGAPPTLFGK